MRFEIFRGLSNIKIASHALLALGGKKPSNVFKDLDGLERRPSGSPSWAGPASVTPPLSRPAAVDASGGYPAVANSPHSLPFSRRKTDARRCISADPGAANAFFDMPETFDGEEVNWFAQHAGKPPVDDTVRHLTGFSPLLLKFYYGGDLPLLEKGPASAWRPALEALAGSELKSGESQLKELNNAGNGHFLYKNKDWRCACLCEPLRRHACLRAIQGATLGMEEVLEIGLAPLLAEEYYGEPPVVAPWNCNFAVATVLRLRESVWLAPVGETIVAEMVSARHRWWTTSWI
ncbi:hypothetical protein SELMODRAFT_406269 [Selaginella moellendorffii]|uniref:Uncharacterized protein n=1 Tax=Selaginella moellendorffii TaxID=88036 RepID=D8R1T9_SELML|nr:hypothetical protein SELMODRAFT_406269 [Selaginella moellendorffii]